MEQAIRLLDGQRTRLIDEIRETEGYVESYSNHHAKARVHLDELQGQLASVETAIQVLQQNV